MIETLLASDSISIDTQSFLDRLGKLDLEPIIYKITHHHDGKGWSVEKADKVAELYKQFLTLIYLYPGVGNVPTRDIDTFWHYHILDTAKYCDDCEKLFGRFIHHFPYFGLRGEEDARNLEMAFERTRALFNEHFGVTFSPEAALPQDCRDDCIDIPCGGPPDILGNGSNQLQFFLSQERPRLIR